MTGIFGMLTVARYNIRLFLKSYLFNSFVESMVFINIIALSMYNLVDEKILNNLNLICNYFFIVEILLKIIGFGKKTFKDHLNILEFILVVSTIIDMAI